MDLNTIKIEVVSTAMREMKGHSERTGRDYHIATQEAYVHRGGAYPEKIELPCIRRADKSGFDPYPVGFYVMTLSNVIVRDGRLTLDFYAAPLVSYGNPLGDANTKPSEALKAADKPARAA
jgi:hypothetical protein